MEMNKKEQARSYLMPVLLEKIRDNILVKLIIYGNKVYTIATAVPLFLQYALQMVHQYIELNVAAK